MKNIDEILNGVTNGGKWDTYNRDALVSGEVVIADFAYSNLLQRTNAENTAYAARACATWPDCIRALESIEAAGRPHGGPTEAPCSCQQCDAWDSAVDVLNKALL